MLRRVWRRNYIVLCAICVHVDWGICLIVSEAPLRTTPMAHCPIRNHIAAGIVYLLIGFMAWLAFWSRRIDEAQMRLGKLSIPVGLWLTIPQQAALMLSAFTAIRAMIVGAYPDGYVPDGGFWFIQPDQAWTAISMGAHTFGVIDWYGASVSDPLDKRKT